MVFHFESVTTLKNGFHKYSCPVKHIRHNKESRRIIQTIAFWLDIQFLTEYSVIFPLIKIIRRSSSLEKNIKGLKRREKFEAENF